MKKLVLFFAAATMTVAASAQVTVVGSKFTDNWYVGVQGGVSTKTNHNRWLSNLNPNAGLRIGKNITPIFGLVAEGNVYFNDRAQYNRARDLRTNTFAKAVNVNLLGNINLMNLFAGYQGEPRFFEVNALFGFGWMHGFGDYEGAGVKPNTLRPVNAVSNCATSKAALDFAFNLGQAKALQVFVEPSINYGIFNNKYEYTLSRSIVQLNAGVIYKFNNSYGAHNFVIAKLYDQDEVDRLNAEINRLKNQKPQVVEKVVEKIVEKKVTVDNMVFITFAQAKSNLTNDAKKALDEIAAGSHVEIIGTASPEGSAEKNQILSQARADAVKAYLEGRGVTVDKSVGKGVQGTTSNRLAIVTVK